MPSIKTMFKALGFTIIVFGSSHLIVSYILMLTRDYEEGNLFRILNYQKLFPGIDEGTTNFVISNIIAVSVYFAILGAVIYFDRKKTTRGLRESSSADAGQGSGEGRNKPYRKVR